MHSHMHSHSCIHIYVQYIQVPLLYLYSNFFIRIYTYVQPIHMDNQLWTYTFVSYCVTYVILMDSILTLLSL